jgi:hypothetical protein
MMKMTIVTIEKDPSSSRASLHKFSFNVVLATCVWITVIMCFVDLFSLQSHGYERSNIGTCGTTLQNQFELLGVFNFFLLGLGRTLHLPFLLQHSLE